MKKCCGVYTLRIAAGITILSLLLMGSAGAMTISVNASGSEDYMRIQDAINASSNGDTILVKSGTYYENVKVNKQLTLRGIGMPVVDVKGRGSPITLSANGITLEGFTATWSGYKDAGIKVTSNNNTLTGNIASNNVYGISLSSSSNNTLTVNKASNNHFGLSLESSSNNILIGNNASNNGNGYNGYGLSLESSNNNTLSNNNASSNNGDGISLLDSSNNTLSGNNASNNGGTGISFPLPTTTLWSVT